MIDTHAHLDACPDPPEELVRRAREAGVRRILTVGTTIEGGRTALSLAEAHHEVFAIVGIHPHEAGSADGVEGLRPLLEHERAVGVGETGLDFYRDYAPRDRQRALFAQHLELARELHKPVVIHNRAADEEVLAQLASFDGDVVLHCFSYPGALATALDRGYYVSFAGNVTYKNAAQLRLAASQVPRERILAETDCPYLSPEPRRGRSNEPANVVHTLDALARVRG
ncbi:MAG TPA: TatD family hydrolase, partial [Gaiellaceae bacterium]|nr:TatD family hydrolase [Gaiellaceae bacterium]